MAETSNQDKERIIPEFEAMKSFERSAQDLYTQIAADPNVGEPKVRTAFASLAADEQRHAELVQEIIHIVSNAL